MTVQLTYALATLLGVVSIGLLWELGFKALFLDIFRARLFELRTKLFALGESGVIAFNDPAYKVTELQINGLIQYAHRLSFTSFMLSAVHSRLTKDDDDSRAFARQVELLRSRTSPVARKKLDEIHQAMSRMVAMHLVLTSLVFKVALVFYRLAKYVSPKAAEARKTQTVVMVEREFYFAAKLTGANAI